MIESDDIDAPRGDESQGFVTGRDMHRLMAAPRQSLADQRGKGHVVLDVQDPDGLLEIGPIRQFSLAPESASISPRVASPEQLDLDVDFAPYRQNDFTALADAWPPLTVAINEINRSLGQRDFYPFVLTAEILAKLAFVHALIASSRSAERR